MPSADCSSNNQSGKIVPRHYVVSIISIRRVLSATSCSNILFHFVLMRLSISLSDFCLFIHVAKCLFYLQIRLEKGGKVIYTLITGKKDVKIFLLFQLHCWCHQ